MTEDELRAIPVGTEWTEPATGTRWRWDGESVLRWEPSPYRIATYSTRWSGGLFAKGVEMLAAMQGPPPTARAGPWYLLDALRTARYLEQMP